jgi:hypothetical protein
MLTSTGRIRSIRAAGNKLLFLDFVQNGRNVQILCNFSVLSEAGLAADDFAQFSHLVRRGDNYSSFLYNKILIHFLTLPSSCHGKSPSNQSRRTIPKGNIPSDDALSLPSRFPREPPHPRSGFPRTPRRTALHAPRGRYPPLQIRHNPIRPRIPPQALLPRSPNPHPSRRSRRRNSPPLQHHSNRVPRPQAITANSPRAMAEAINPRRPRPGFRNRPLIPQRRPRQEPQPRVHNLRVLRGLRVPRRPNPHDRRATQRAPPAHPIAPKELPPLHHTPTHPIHRTLPPPRIHPHHRTPPRNPTP